MRYLLTVLLGFVTLGIFYACQKEISTEYGSPARGALQLDSVGDCTSKVVQGSFIAARALTDSNFVEVKVVVASPGPYTVFTDTVNGYAFKATGTFTATGVNTVRLKGGGTPILDGTDDFTVFFDSSACLFSVTVLPAGSTGGPASFSLAGAPNACAPFTSAGNYFKDTTLDGRHTVTVDVNVTVVGTYSVSTPVKNGYSFSTSGTFGAPGAHTITLRGSGKPLAARIDTFAVTAGGSSCSFTINVTGITPPAGCNPNVQGTYTATTATTTANKVTLTHTYTGAGPYTVTTGLPVNGYSFVPTSYTATPGVSNTITLNAAGTPLAVGINTFTVDFGDGTNCTFTVTVVSAPVVNNDYFPTTLNSYWTYDYSPTDTFKMTNRGPVIPTGQTGTPQTYQRFEYTDAGGPFYEEFYRKEANGFYYQLMDTSGFGQDSVFFNRAKLDVLFLKNSLTNGATWNTDFSVTFRNIPTVLRYKYECTDANATAIVNGKTFTNVYSIKFLFQFPSAATPGTWIDASNPIQYYYARGIGLIRVDYPTGNDQLIRTWQVN